MKIVMLNGQNHKGSSYNIGRIVANKVKGSNKIIEYFFPKDLNHFCMGCYKCIENVADCPFYPEKEKILNDIYEADIIIVTTPTYCMNMSGSLKAFFDMTFDMWMVHKPIREMFFKRAVVVTACAGGGAKKALNSVKECLFNEGVAEIYTFGCAVQAMNWESVSEKIKTKIDKGTSKIAKKLNVNRKPRVGIKTKAMFNIMRLMHKAGWDSSKSEQEYWREKGWLDKARPWKQ